MGGSWRNIPGNGAKGGRTGRAYRELLESVRERAKNGEPCWKCGQYIDTDLPKNSKRAFTMHHLDSLMHGHPATCDPDRVVPCHRGCNASLGLREQNARRKAARAATTPPHTSPTPPPPEQEPHSQTW